jgi:hypothetical protein
MHVGMRTQAFGSVEVHTVVRDSQLGLIVGAERGDLRTLLAPEVPGLETVFRQNHLNFEGIRFLNSGNGANPDSSMGSHAQSRSSDQGNHSPPSSSSPESFPDETPSPDPWDTDRPGLNVQA